MAVGCTDVQFFISDVKIVIKKQQQQPPPLILKLGIP